MKSRQRLEMWWWQAEGTHCSAMGGNTEHPTRQSGVSSVSRQPLPSKTLGSFGWFRRISSSCNHIGFALSFDDSTNPEPCGEDPSPSASLWSIPLCVHHFSKRLLQRLELRRESLVVLMCFPEHYPSGESTGPLPVGVKNRPVFNLRQFACRPDRWSVIK